MICCHVEPPGIKIQMEKGETLHAGLERSGIHIETPCGGNGICGACRVWVNPPGNTPSTPHENISPEDDIKGLRLACRIVPTDDIFIRLEDHFIYDQADGHQEKIFAHTLRAPDSFTPMGLAIDIGTTTLEVCLYSLATGKILGTAASLNPQVIHGHDVLTRIQYAKTLEGLEKMAFLIRKKLKSLIDELCSSSGIEPEEIVDGVIGANTTMLQLAARMDSTSIGLSPFTFDIKGGASYPAGFFGLKLNKAAKIYIPPVLHAYIGSDISAGLLACPDFFDTDKTLLFIDMGTNGEICLNVKGSYFATSTAAGPAFEGMGVSSGMRAGDGAVERVEFKDNTFEFLTISNAKIKGICGSGMVDLMAALLKSGHVAASGRFLKTGPEDPYMTKFKDRISFQYAQGIYLTQKDIRQIQLAKGAVRTGIDLILEAGGINCQDLDKIYMA
ncbi:MAG: ASKHA domain-containing protein, partial [Desulfobacula sp.]